MDFRQQISTNKRKTYLIIVLFIAFIFSVAYVLGEASGYGLSFSGIALILSGVSSIGSFYFSDKIVLSLSGAKEADRKTYFNYYTAAENMAVASGLPRPRLYLIEDTAMNAFATGRDPQHAVVVATSGLLKRLDRSDIEGVVAHEMSHIQNYDTRLMGVLAVLVGSVALLSDLFVRNLGWGTKRSRKSGRTGIVLAIVGVIFALLAPLAAKLIQLALSRNREYLADATAVKFTRNPEGLAHALEEIAKDTEVLEAATNATAHLYITNPVMGEQKAFSSKYKQLFNTHPPIAERIKRLRQLH